MSFQERFERIHEFLQLNRLPKATLFLPLRTIQKERLVSYLFLLNPQLFSRQFLFGHLTMYLTQHKPSLLKVTFHGLLNHFPVDFVVCSSCFCVPTLTFSTHQSQLVRIQALLHLVFRSCSEFFLSMATSCTSTKSPSAKRRQSKSHSSTSNRTNPHALFPITCPLKGEQCTARQNGTG